MAPKRKESEISKEGTAADGKAARGRARGEGVVDDLHPQVGDVACTLEGNIMENLLTMQDPIYVLVKNLTGSTAPTPIMACNKMKSGWTQRSTLELSAAETATNGHDGNMREMMVVGYARINDVMRDSIEDCAVKTRSRKRKNGDKLAGTHKPNEGFFAWNEDEIFLVATARQFTYKKTDYYVLMNPDLITGVCEIYRIDNDFVYYRSFFRTSVIGNHEARVKAWRSIVHQYAALPVHNPTPLNEPIARRASKKANNNTATNAIKSSPKKPEYSFLRRFVGADFSPSDARAMAEFITITWPQLSMFEPKVLAMLHQAISEYDGQLALDSVGHFLSYVEDHDQRERECDKDLQFDQKFANWLVGRAVPFVSGYASLPTITTEASEDDAQDAPNTSSLGLPDTDTLRSDSAQNPGSPWSAQDQDSRWSVLDFFGLRKAFGLDKASRKRRKVKA